jgi:hypothetical protein
MTSDEKQGDAKIDPGGDDRRAENPFAALRGYAMILGLVAGSFLLFGAFDFLKLWLQGDSQTRETVSNHLWLTAPLLLVGAGLGIILALGFFSAVGRFIAAVFTALFTPIKRP